MNTLFKVGHLMVRAENVTMARHIAWRSSKVQGIEPIRLPAFYNQSVAMAGYDNAIADETLGLIERFARKAIAAKRASNNVLSSNQKRTIEQAAINTIASLFN